MQPAKYGSEGRSKGRFTVVSEEVPPWLLGILAPEYDIVQGYARIMAAVHENENPGY